MKIIDLLFSLSKFCFDFVNDFNWFTLLNAYHKFSTMISSNNSIFKFLNNHTKHFTVCQAKIFKINLRVT